MDAILKPGLTQPRGRTNRGTAVLAVGLVLFALLVLLVVLWGDLALEPIPGLGTIHAVAMLVICATTAALLLTHAQAAEERGYLILGGTFLYVAGVMLLFPTVYPNGVIVTDPPSVLWGSMQSSATLFLAWHLAVVVGIPVGAVVLGLDLRNGRRPGLGHGMGLTIGLSIAAVIVTGLAVVPFIDVLPPVVDGTAMAGAGLAVQRMEAVLAFVGTVVVAAEVRSGSRISRWLLAVMVVTLGEAVVAMGVERYSLGWYYQRVVGLVAALILLIVLIRDLGRVERVTKQMVDRDALTGAASRAAILATLDREIRRGRHAGQPVVFVWVDIDGFKEINERVGQQVGDRILAEACHRIADIVGEVAFVGRMGGDEFAAVLPGADAGAGDQVAGRVVARLREPFHVLDAVVVLTSSVGLAMDSDGLADAEVMARRASLAMLSAKESGGDRHAWFAEDLGSDALRRAQLRHALTQAIRDREFALEYQPIIDLVTGEVTGAEALVGWMQDGQREPAGRFISFAEESGLIVAIGRQVVDSLEAEVPRILDAVPPPFVLTFNLSVKELADEGIVERLLHGPLAEHARRLVIEVTESFEMTAASRSARDLERMRRVGYGVAIDDFGAGFSNFTRLAELRPTIVKIDRGIVVRAGQGSADGVATLRATAEVARSLQGRVLAEGVESNDEAEICMRTGIELAQGYRYSRSLSVEALLAFWAARAVRREPSVADLGELAGRDRDA